MRKYLLLAAGILLGVLALDQATKCLVEAHFRHGESLPLLPFFNLTYVRNEGAAWGMFAGSQFWLALFGAVAILVCCFFWKKLFGPHPKMLLPGALLVSGIIGNLIDRVRLNYVIDFFDFHWGLHHFPVFNVADVAICVSVFLILLLQWLDERKTRRTQANAAHE